MNKLRFLKKKSVRTIVSVIVTTAAGYYVVQTLLNNWERVRQYDFSFDFYGVSATVIFMMAIVISGYLWGLIVQQLSGRDVSVSDSVRTHILSWLLKYIPGQAGSYLGKLKWGIDNGFSKKNLTNSFIYENIFLATSSVILSVPLILYYSLDKFQESLSLLVPLLIIPFIALLLYRPFYHWALNLLMKAVGREKVEKTSLLGGKSVGTFQLYYLLPRILNAVGFIVVVASITNITGILEASVLGAVYVLAGIVGILAIFVPSGLGVREAVIIAFAGAIIGQEAALIAALLSRLYATLSDAILGVVYLTIKEGKT